MNSVVLSLVLLVLLNITGIKSAFTVNYPAAGTTSGTISFTRIVTNIGGHYNTTSGKFTCQYPGIYVFLLHIWKNAGERQAYCYIRKNKANMVLADSYVNDNTLSNFDGVSTSVILHLVHGDIVDIGDCTDIGTFYGGLETSFSGFLLQED